MAHIPLLLLDQLMQQGQQGLGLGDGQGLHCCPQCLCCCLPHWSYNLFTHPSSVKDC